MVALQCYQWLKEKIISEEGRKQQGKLKDLSPIAERLGCTLPQLAVGECHLQGCPCPSAGLTVPWERLTHKMCCLSTVVCSGPVARDVFVV